ncbi:MAG TPA: DUF2793 domain-containing protein [Mesorhizobium sp.]|nr:DUF2793 domain-containing protein [Mesorhizobium sp.]
MTERTTHLAMPFILPSQAQKHVTHNEALQILDAVVQLSVKGRDLAAPPAAVSEGDRFLVPESGLGDWEGKAGRIATRQDGAWVFATPRTGWLVWIADEERLIAFDGGAWRDAALAGVNPTALVGINATADATNRLAVKSQAALFDHEGADHRLKINKAAASATASVLFQSGYSGRAEIGLAGDDHWRLKASADGATWREALAADAASGAVRFPGGVEHAASRAPMSGLIFTPGGDGQVSIYRNDASRSQNPRTTTLGAVADDMLTLAANDAPLFFHTFMEGVSYVRVWNVSKTPLQSAWVRASPAVNRLQVLSSAGIAGWTAGETIQVGDPTTAMPGRVVALDISPMLQNVLGAVFPQRGILCKAGLAASAAGADLGASPSGVPGSFVTGAKTADAANVWPGLALIPCTLPSPVSDSNLVLLRETATGTLGTALLSSVAVLG